MSEPGPPKTLVVAWGGGVNSTAVLIGLQQRGYAPDCILFADTGGEKPETYLYRDTIDAWLASVDFPSITVVKNDGAYSSLEDECLKKRTLPSIAFGFKSCSDKYKRRPQIKYLLRRYGNLSSLLLSIGFDADEAHRANQPAFEAYEVFFPLIQWGWGRAECVAAIEGAGLPVPPKSACYFCPSSRKAEVMRLASEHPELFHRAVAMERNATAAHTVKGLGRRWSWEQLVAAAPADLPVFQDAIETPCGCFDGDD